MKLVKIKIKMIIKTFLVIYGVLMMLYSITGGINPCGEWDDYTIPTASIMNDHNFSISQNDLMLYSELFPEMRSYLQHYELSGYVARNGGEMTWYFPTYAIISVPGIKMLQMLKISPIYVFPLVNILCVISMLMVVYYCLKIDEKKKLILIILLSINPIIFYFGWMSAETMIFSLLGITMVCWYNDWYKRAAIFISIAGTLNPTVLIVGITMIIEYLCKLIINEKETYKGIVKRKSFDVLSYGACYLIALIPFAYNYYNTGFINLTASYSSFTQGKESVFSRFLAYIFDLNFGLLPYYFLLLLVAIALFIVALKRKHIKFLEWIGTFLVNIFLYSIMVHINCGMSGIARYNAWCAVILIFSVVLYFDEIIVSNSIKYIMRWGMTASAILTGAIVLIYGPYQARDTNYTYMMPIAKMVLDISPNLYNPLPSTFNSRVTHVDGGYSYDTPVIYSNEKGYIRKILASKKDIDVLRKSCQVVNGDTEWFEKELDKLNEREEYISIPSEIVLVEIKEY